MSATVTVLCLELPCRGMCGTWSDKVTMRKPNTVAAVTALAKSRWCCKAQGTTQRARTVNEEEMMKELPRHSSRL